MGEKYIDIHKLDANGGAPPGVWINERGGKDYGGPYPRGIIDRVFDFLDARAENRRSKRERAAGAGAPPAEDSRAAPPNGT